MLSAHEYLHLRPQPAGCVLPLQNVIVGFVAAMRLNSYKIEYPHALPTATARAEQIPNTQSEGAMPMVTHQIEEVKQVSCWADAKARPTPASPGPRRRSTSAEWAAARAASACSSRMTTCGLDRNQQDLFPPPCAYQSWNRSCHASQQLQIHYPNTQTTATAGLPKQTIRSYGGARKQSPMRSTGGLCQRPLAQKRK